MGLFSNITDKELFKKWQSYYETIYGVQPCYGVKDLLILSEIEKEMNKRNLRVDTIYKLIKGDD